MLTAIITLSITDKNEQGIYSTKVHINTHSLATK